jgi:NAD(P)-dependent dehydrogenase (short-subunit alcohol dehydrogenase family)
LVEEVSQLGGQALPLAGIVEFLISPAAAYMTGQNIVADGGLLDSIQAHIKGRPVSQT